MTSLSIPQAGERSEPRPRAPRGKWRVKQIRVTAALVEQVSRTEAGLRLVRFMRSFVLTRRAYAALLHYRRPFASLHEARQALGQLDGTAHESSSNIEWHARMQAAIRPSDYAALFQLRPLLPHLTRIFDLGGNVGNLFYSYARYVEFPPELTWQVFDLPAVVASGTALARQRNASQVRFTSTWQDADGADLLIAAGSLHYFEVPLWAMVSELSSKPRYILVNRTPLNEDRPVAAVQDSIGIQVACFVYNRSDMIRGFERIGYELVDQWRAPELGLTIPGYPELSAPEYSGFFLKLPKAALQRTIPLNFE